MSGLTRKLTGFGGSGGSGGTIVAADITDASANGRSILTAANYAAMRTSLGLVIGTNVQAWDADLDSLAASSANGVSLITAANYAAMRVLLGDREPVAWASRGSGSFVGQTKIITDAGNNPTYEAVWDGTMWQPRGGLQLYYQMAAAVVGNTSTTSTATLPTVSILAGILGTKGALQVDLMAAGDTGTSITSTDSITYGAGTFLNNTSNGTQSRRNYKEIEFRNLNIATSQILRTKATGGEYGGGASQGSTAGTMGVSSATAQDLAGSIVQTFSGAQTTTIYLYRIWIVAGY